jgi:hypothetical protein
MNEISVDHQIVSLLVSYEAEKINEERFVAEFHRLWKIWRDERHDDCPKYDHIANLFDRAFTASDSFKPDSVKFRLKSDIDEIELRSEIRKIVKEIRLLVPKNDEK